MRAVRVHGLTYFLPSQALAEVRLLWPDSESLLEDLASHPHVIVGELEPADASAVARRLDAGETFDVLAGWVSHACRTRR